MNKKYYADIDLYFEDIKHGIIGEIGTKKQEIVDLVKDFAKRNSLTCDTKSKKLFDKNGKEVGSFIITSRTI